MTDLLRWTLLVIGGVLALGSALSISRSPHWAVRLWDFPRVQIAALLAACGAGYLAVGWGGQPWEWIWLAAVGIAFAWQLRWILPYTPLAPTAVQRSGGRGGPRLRLLFVNVLMENQEHGRLLKVVRDAEPDLVLAVEVDRAWERALEPLEADFPHSVRQVQDNYYGMVLLSRRPLHATRIDFLVQDDIPSLYAEAEIEGGARVVVHGLHPRPPEPIRDQSSAPRDAELVVVGRAIGESSDRPTLVAGDLNDVAWSHTTALFVKLSGLLDPRLGRGFFNSFHAGNPVLRWPLDHIFHSTHFRLVELRRMPPIGSDHFPMLVELALDPDARASQEEPERDADDEQEASEHLDRQASDAAEGKDRPGRPVNDAAPHPTPSQRVRGHAVHLLTASGVGVAFAAAAEIASPEPDPRLVFLLFAAATLIDAADGPLARAWQVKRWAPEVDGRTIDDLVDYLTFTFLPLLLVWRMGWVPEPGWVWIVPALIASLFGFAHVGAKDEGGGFFRGFPSYWNATALYLGLWYHAYGPAINAGVILALAALTVAPVWFVYPNLAPRPWRTPVLAGAALWLGAMVWMVAVFPDVPAWAIWLSLSYPALYSLLSFHLARGRGR